MLGSSAVELCAQCLVSCNAFNGGWRREWDSNPRWACTHGGFQDRCLKPLGHLSRWSARVTVTPRAHASADALRFCAAPVA